MPETDAHSENLRSHETLVDAQRIKIARIVGLVSTVSSFLWACLSLALGVPLMFVLTASAAVLVGLGTLFLYSKHTLLARSYLITIGNLTVFSGTWIIDSSGRLDITYAAIMGACFVLFDVRKETRFLLAMFAETALIWLLAFTLPDMINLPIIVTGQEAKFISYATVVTVLILLPLQFYYFAQKELQHSNELRSALQSAITANRAKSNFLATMSHEIRTPMNGVVGMADVMKTTELTKEQRRMLSTIQDSSHALLRIIDDILDLSKLEANKLTLDFTPVRMVELIENVMNTVRPISEDKGVRLHLSLEPDVRATTKSDPVRLRQILINLLGNAIKFSADQPGRAGAVDLHVSRPTSDRIEFEITDNGIGMPEDVQKRLFLPFSQADEGTTRRYGGTGLGLSITRTLVDLLEGEIRVTSEEGQGSTFTVSLPFKEIADPIHMPDISGLLIYAYIDDQASCESLADFVHRMGSRLVKVDDYETLERNVKGADAGTIILVAQRDTQSNIEIIQKLHAIRDDMKYLNAVTSRVDIDGESHKNCFRLQRFPMLPSEFLDGLVNLSGRAPENHRTSKRQEQPDSPESFHPKDILLVEDNEVNQRVIRLQLERLGHRVTSAHDGLQGQSLWEQNKFDLILTDLHMPRCDGYQLTKAIRAAEKDGQHTPILAITANALAGEKENCLGIGMDDYLTKPIEFAKLKAALDAQSR